MFLGVFLRVVAFRMGRQARAALTPLAYVAIIAGLSVITFAANILGDDHDNGRYLRGITRILWAQENLIYRGLQMTWLAWLLALLAIEWDGDHAGRGAVFSLLLVAGGAAYAAWCLWRASHHSVG